MRSSPIGDLVKDEVGINHDMFHVLMQNGVGRQVYCTDIVAIYKCATGQTGVQLHE
jgi:hypothetical protein